MCGITGWIDWNSDISEEHHIIEKMTEVDSEGLAEIFALGPARSPGHGVYRGMAEVKPGHYMIYNLETTAERVCDLLGDTVKRQLVSDVPVCVLLSGCLDSSALTAYAAAAFKDAGSGPLHTYSVDYLDNESHLYASYYYIHPDEYIAARYRETIAEVNRLNGESPLEARRREMFYLNIKWFMATLLNRKDRMSMANGLEVRVPFCDHRLVEYVWNIPWEMKTYGGQAKGILRKALSGVLPEKVLKRGKSPYPKTHHPAYLKAVKKRLLRILDEPDSPISELIDLPAVLDLIMSKKKYFTHPWFGQLMGDAQFFAYLLEINTWLREYRVKIV